MEKQFAMLDKVPPSFSDKSSATKPENKALNTDPSVLPCK